jgi:predicted glutamine amidotransferase
MACYVGDSRRDLYSLLRGLQRAANRDTTSGKPLKHGHGWGYAIYSEANGDHRPFIYKSERAIYNKKEKRVPLPKTKGRIYAILHARRASPGYKPDKCFSHPFYARIQGKDVYFAHNGKLEEAELRKELGFNGPTIDSELGLRFIERSGLSLEEGSSALAKYVAGFGAMNILMLEIRENGEAGIYYENYLGSTGDARREYYRMYREETKGGTAVYSSTLKNYGFEGRPVEEDQLVLVPATKER